MSMRRRLLLSHSLIVVLCLVIVAVAATGFLRGYRDTFTRSRLDDMTLPIYVQARSMAQSKATLNEVWSNLVEQAHETGVLVLLVDPTGKVIRQETPDSFPVDGPIARIPLRLLPADFSEPHYGTYRIPDSGSIAFAAYPLAPLFASPNPGVPEALVLAVPRESTLALFGDIAEPCLWAGIIALVVSVAVAFVLARSLHRPVQRVTEAANEMAAGRFDQTIPASGPREIAALARSFNEMAAQVRLSQERLRRFLADVSHELRTPLTSIRGFAQAIADGTAVDEASRARSAGIIAEESERVTRLVNELLELSKIESGQIEMARETVDLAALLQHCADVFSLRADQAHTKLITELEPLPYVIGDTDRLEQVLANLIDNALKHAPEGGQVKVRARAKSPDSVEVSVIDSGPGVPAEDLPHVFDRFYRGDAAGTGAGLGLAIARQIVRAHGGDIEVGNLSEKGAEFRVRLPAKAATR